MAIDSVEIDNGPAKLNRRQFLKSAGMSAFLAATHQLFAFSKRRNRYSEHLDHRGLPLLRSLRLKTATPLAQMKRFYCDMLELPLMAEQSNQITVGAGQTPITFVSASSGGGQPFYHFAFNIPENKLLAARAWQKERTSLIPPYARLRDSDYPDDVVHFRNWNSHSIFFWDPAGNLLEYIARHDLKNSASGLFTSEDILYASEIGFIVDDVCSTTLELNETFGLEQYRGGSDVFTAVGDEHGLLLVMKRGRVLGFDEGKDADIFPTAATIRGKKLTKYISPDFPYKISAE